MGHDSINRLPSAIPATLKAAGQEPGSQEDDTHSVGSELKWTRRFCGGLIRDITKNAPYYISDWKDAFTRDTWQQCLASIMFLFFACLSPAIAFGTIYIDATDKQIGVVETILSSAIGGIIYSLFSGQPLCIIGATGPDLAYTVAFYKSCQSLDIDFLNTRVWQGIWCSVASVIIAVFDGCCLMQYVTRYVEEIFSALISIIFIYEALKAVAVTFGNRSTACAFLTAILCFSTYGLAINLKNIKRSKWFLSPIRFTISNFAVIIAIVTVAGISRIWANEVEDIDWLEVPDKVEPGYIANGSPRPWVINPFGNQGLNDKGVIRGVPVWAIFYAIPWGLGMAVLHYLDQNLTSLLINRPTSGLKKPIGYHLDWMVLACVINPLVCILGLPSPVAATVRSLTHLISLTTYEERPIPGGGVQRVAAGVIEQRWTHFAIHVLLLLSLALSGILKYVPKAVLFGVFLYMGLTSVAGNQLFDRLFLFGNWDPKTYPRLPYVTRLRTSRLHMFTGIQFVCLVILYALKAIKETAVAFPFFIALLIFVRIGLNRVFTKEELEVLDSHDDLPPDEDKEEKEEEANAGKNVGGEVQGGFDRQTSGASKASKASKQSKASETPEEALARMKQPKEVKKSDPETSVMP